MQQLSFSVAKTYFNSIMERAIAMNTVRDRDRDRDADADASFSSYLRPDNKAATTTITGEESTTELSIFDAHKYFNDDNNNNTNMQKVSINRVSPMERIPERGDLIITEATRYSSASSSVDSYAHIRNYRARSFHAATPTASSEASWNSQTGLLSHPPGAIPVTIRNPQNPKIPKLSKPIWRRKCPCTGKKSVQVKESTIQESKSQQERDYEHHHNVRNHIITPNNWIVNPTPAPIQAPATSIVDAKSQRFQNANSHRVVSSARVPFTEGFTFPVLNPNNPIPKLKLANGVVVEEDPPRDSLEIFRPPDEPLPSTSPKPPLNFPFTAKSRAVVIDDDAASDASSDLFEIESFSTATQSTYAAAYRRNSRDSFDEGSTTPTITECYEPSEASIEWSVTTAEGHEETVSAGEEKWKRKGGNGLLVNCRCEKSVSVGPQPVKCVSEGRRGATSSSNVNLISSSSNSSSRIGSVNKPPLGRAHNHRNAPRVSLTFAT